MIRVTLAGLLLASALTVSGFAQVKPGINKNHVTSIAASSAGVANATRVRITGAVNSTAIPSSTEDAGRVSSAPVTGATSRPFENSAAMTALTQVYRIGVGDVLDIQLNQNAGRQSTLFTVLDGGLVDYPLAGEPLAVAGLTPNEVAERLAKQIKLFSSPGVAVKVRDYASHNVTINGFVSAPGVKKLRREAVPFYAVLSESLPLPEAAYATIIRKGRSPLTIGLRDTVVTATLVLPGDVIRISAEAPTAPEFYFAGGEINAPGQKLFHSGLTLTQAILASGGLSMSAGSTVRLSRQGNDGRLAMTEYNLALIQSGRVADPALLKGDRIEVSSARP
jgi:protein involved in polysaccharide export with SLBB domain